MIRRSLPFVCCIAAIVLAVSTNAWSAKFNKKVEIGDKAPVFESLAGIDGKSHSLGDYKDANLVVVTFTCNQCPVAVAYEDRFIAFAKEYREKGVAFVAINVNNAPAEDLEKMKRRAQEKEFTFDYLNDPTQAIGRAYGATCTPHLFVLDKDRKIAYMGAFDDTLTDAQVKKQYLRNAVDALLAGKTPEVAETMQRGCGITYEKQ